MTVRPATMEDLPKLAHCALEFYSTSRFLKDFRMERFCETWKGLLESGAGAIFLLTEAEEILGTIGGVAYQEPYSYDILAQEFWWYVLKGSRGGGLRLYRAFEDWAKSKDCSTIRMAYLTDSMPDKVARCYERMGFVPTEMTYSKELRHEPQNPSV